MVLRSAKNLNENRALENDRVRDIEDDDVICGESKITSSGTYDFEISNGEGVLAAYERIKVFAPSLTQKHMATARHD